MADGIQTRTLTLNLLENGIDFVKEGIETYFPHDTPDPRAHKYAILHMWSGTLLILKECLRRINPDLIFKEPAEAGMAGAKTVDFDQVIRRLKQNGVPIDPAKETTLRTVQKIRNGMEHYELVLDLDQAKAVIGELTGFLYTFCVDHLNVFLEDRLSVAAHERFFELKEVTDKLMDIMSETAAMDAEADDAYFREFAEKYLAMSPEAFLELIAAEGGFGDPNVRPLECPACGEDTIALFEVGVCTVSTCRAWFYLDQCNSCYVPVLRGTYVCGLCGP